MGRRVQRGHGKSHTVAALLLALYDGTNPIPWDGVPSVQHPIRSEIRSPSAHNPGRFLSKMNKKTLAPSCSQPIILAQKWTALERQSTGVGVEPTAVEEEE